MLMSINITIWSGRLGNNITQLVNAILFANYNNIEKIFFPKHFYFKDNFINLEKYKSKNSYVTNNKIYKSDFFSRDEICKQYNLSKEIFINDKINIREIIKDIFNLKIINLNFTDNDLVIHIRSGDVYSKYPHSGWIQPPLSFYKTIINEKKWDKIILICEDDKSPIIKPLINEYRNIIFKINSLNEDINIIIQAKNICFGMGSFIPSLLLLNDNINTIYYPSYCHRYLLDLLYCKNKKVYELENYINKGEWKNTEEQRNIMLTYNILNILC